MYVLMLISLKCSSDSAVKGLRSVSKSYMYMSMLYVALLTDVGQLLNSILTILLTGPNSDTLLCYSNDPFVTVFTCDC